MYDHQLLFKPKYIYKSLNDRADFYSPILFYLAMNY